MTTAYEELVRIPAGAVDLDGDLAVPVGALGVVAFAHGSGSSRHSLRNQYVARALRQADLGTLLVDLLTEEEDGEYATRFDIGLLSARFAAIVRWLAEQPRTRPLPIGAFGASTGAAAALNTAARVGPTIRAVVSRGGRPDLAAADLLHVHAPTLLIVGGDDTPVIEMNRFAYDRLAGPKEMAIVPGATHLFDEPGTLEEVARMAQYWFARWFARIPEMAA
jgi:putative phosphoribosyl transferase